MISKKEFLERLAQMQPISEQEERAISEEFEPAYGAAEAVAAYMPSVGFLSVRKRLNVFLAVCRHLDQLVDGGEISSSQAQLSLSILRLSCPSFRKAITMFDLRASRFKALERAEMPKTAQEYWAGLQTYG